MNIGSRLKQILQERNMNVSQLARTADIPAQTLYAMIKRDSNKADMDIMAKLLNALDMEFMEFMGQDWKKAVKENAAQAKQAGQGSKEKARAVKTGEKTQMQQLDPEKEQKTQPSMTGEGIRAERELPIKEGSPAERELPVKEGPPAEIVSQEKEEPRRQRRRELEDYLL